MENLTGGTKTSKTMLTVLKSEYRDSLQSHLFRVRSVGLRKGKGDHLLNEKYVLNNLLKNSRVRIIKLILIFTLIGLSTRVYTDTPY